MQVTIWSYAEFQMFLFSPNERKQLIQIWTCEVPLLPTLFFVLFFDSWWCHADDDAYVTVENLLKLLSNYDPHKEKIYIGRRSIPENVHVSWSKKQRPGTCFRNAIGCFVPYLVFE